MSYARTILCHAAGVFASLAVVLASAHRSQGEPAQPHESIQRTFYVDSSDGMDDSDGLAPTQPWKSLDRVNAADLKPGDSVRFKRGGIWRGSLVPVSGEEGMPVTYTSYGEGPKPRLLGSLPRNRPEDWVRIEENIWATLPIEYTVGKQVFDLRQGEWSHHQEQGASIRRTRDETPQGALIRLACEASGTASNHIQLWGPTLPVEKGTQLQFTFRARCSKPFALPPMSICMSRSPWTSYASTLRHKTRARSWTRMAGVPGHF